MEQISSVGAGYVAGLIDVVARAGISRTALLQHAGFDEIGTTRTNTRMPMADLICLFQSAVTLTRRPDIGLEFARHVRPGTFHVLGYALMTCKTLGDAIALVPHYRRLVFDIGYSEMRFVHHDDQARLSWHVMSASLPYCNSLAESLIASWYQFGRWMAGVELPLKEVLFKHEAPADISPYESFFECRVRFDAGENTLVFSRSLLDMPLLQADETLHLVMRGQAQAAMEKTFTETDLTYRLRQALTILMPKCEATLAKTSAAMHMSSRSVQRRLGEAGLGFQGVLNAVRKDMAVIYLRDQSLSLLDVALLLGYAEQSSFTRAFRGWFAVNPSAWRKSSCSMAVGSPLTRPQGLQRQ